jgi:hypothetical protein
MIRRHGSSTGLLPTLLLLFYRPAAPATHHEPFGSQVSTCTEGLATVCDGGSRGLESEGGTFKRREKEPPSEIGALARIVALRAALPVDNCVRARQCHVYAGANHLPFTGVECRRPRRESEPGDCVARRSGCTGPSCVVDLRHPTGRLSGAGMVPELRSRRRDAAAST